MTEMCFVIKNKEGKYWSNKKGVFVDTLHNISFYATETVANNCLENLCSCVKWVERYKNTTADTFNNCYIQLVHLECSECKEGVKK